MYAVLRRYRFDPNQSEQLARQMDEGLVPLLRQTPGFVSYDWVDTGNGEAVGISVFGDQMGMRESSRLVKDFVQDRLQPLLGLQEPEELLSGAIRARTERGYGHPRS